MPRAKTAPAIATDHVSEPTPRPKPTPRLAAPAERPPAGPLWIPAPEAAAYLGLTLEALKGRAKQGLLGFKEGGRWRFSIADLQRYTQTVETRHVRSLPRR